MAGLIGWRMYASLGFAVVLLFGYMYVSGLRSDVKAAKQALSTAQTMQSIAQSETAACRAVVEGQNGKIAQLAQQATDASTRADDAAKAALKRPRRPLAGHGWENLNAWMDSL